MVATLPSSVVVPPPSTVAGRGGLVRFTVDDGLAMVRHGRVAVDFPL